MPRSDDEISRWRAAGYWRGVGLGEMLAERAAAHPDRTALVDGPAGAGRRVSYAELDRWADRLAAGLAGEGLHAGDRVVVQLPNVAEFVAVCFALFRVGAVPVFALPTFRETEIRHLAELSGACALVVPDTRMGFDFRELAAAIQRAVPAVRTVLVAGEAGPFRSLSDLADDVAADPIELPSGDPAPDAAPDPTDVAFFLLSGGTTALPKLIPRTHDDYLYQARITAELCGLGADGVYLAVLPVEFNFPWGCPGIIGALQVGATAVLARYPSPDECFALIEAERVTLTSVVPTVLHTWLEAVDRVRPDLSSLRVLQVGSAKLHRETAEQVEPALGTRLQQVFGMAEGLLTFTRLDDPAEVVLGTQGTPVSPADEVRVADPDGVAVPAGATGELLTRGPYTLRGYFRAPEHNATAFTADGFYRSGDLVRLTDRGDMVVEGRIKDVVVRGGDKVSATEVESHLTAHEHVAQAAVVAMPDRTLGERTCAFIIAHGPAPSLVELKKMMRSRGIAEYKLPDHLEVVDRFPLTGLGKVDKNALRDDIAERVEHSGGR